MDFLLLFLYLAVFFAIINLGRLYRNSSLSRTGLNLFFILKLSAALFFFLIYTRYYSRNTSDAFKYFDDSQVLYKALYDDPSSYLKIVTGIDDSAPELDQYYGQMESWNRSKNYSEGLNDNRTIVRINALLSPISFGVYYVHVIFFCFIAFTGLVMLYRFIESFSSGHSKWIALIIFLSPSILFWSSGILKESIVLFGLGGFLFSFKSLLEQRRKRYAIGTVFFLILLLLVKSYVLLTLIPALLFWFVATKNDRSGIRRSLIIVATGATGILIFLSTSYGHSALKSISGKQKDFINLSKGGSYLISCSARDTIYIKPEHETKLLTRDSVTFMLPEGAIYHHWTYWKILDTVRVSKPDTTCYHIYGVFGKTGSTFQLTELQPNLTSFLSMLPEALCNTLFRPFPNEIRSAMIAITFIENMIYLAIILYFLSLVRHPSYRAICFMLGSLLFVFLLSTLIGYVTPVTGALVRYRIPLLPFFLGSILFFADPSRLKVPQFTKRLFNE